MTKDIESNFHFIGNQNARDEAVEYIDQILKEKGNFEGFFDLTAGLEVITTDFRVEVTDDDDSYSVNIRALSGNGDILNFVIDRNTGTIYRQQEDIDEPLAEDDEDMDFLDEI